MLTPPADVLRHRPPALLLATVETFEATALSCRSVARGAWRWPELLEGGAQCAGLLAGLQPGGPDAHAVIAEYRGVRLHATPTAGTVRFFARLERRLLHFWRCRVEVRDPTGALLLDGRVTVARAS